MVTPHLKNSNLDNNLQLKTDTKYSPIFKLHFLSKIFERTVSK